MRFVRSLLVLLASLSAFAVIAQQNPPQWSSTTAYLGGTLVRASDGNFYRATHDSTGKNPTLDNHSFWELYYVRANTVLPVGAGARFSSFKQAWAMLAGAETPGTSTIDIRINGQTSQYVENITTPISLNLTCGAHVTITGQGSVRFQLPTASNGFTLSGGHTFGGINNVSIDGTAIDPSFRGTAITVTDGSMLLNSKLAIQNIANGVTVQHGAKAFLDGTNISNCDGGFLADQEGYIHAQKSTVTNCIGGFTAINHSTIDAVQAYVDTASDTCFSAQVFSTVLANATFANHAEFGFHVTGHSTIDCSSASLSNDVNGIGASQGSYVTAPFVKMNQVQVPYSPALNTAVTDGSFITSG